MDRIVVFSVALWFVSVLAYAADAKGAVAQRAEKPLSGRDVYAQSCAMCHTTGVGGAPRPGKPEDWGERLKNGPAELLVSVLRGKGGMPPKGGNASLTRGEAYLALDYMLNGEK